MDENKEERSAKCRGIEGTKGKKILEWERRSVVPPSCKERGERSSREGRQTQEVKKKGGGEKSC